MLKGAVQSRPDWDGTNSHLILWEMIVITPTAKCVNMRDAKILFDAVLSKSKEKTRNSTRPAAIYYVVMA